MGARSDLFSNLVDTHKLSQQENKNSIKKTMQVKRPDHATLANSTHTLQVYQNISIKMLYTTRRAFSRVHTSPTDLDLPKSNYLVPCCHGMTDKVC